MQTDIKARGFVLTSSLRLAVMRSADDYGKQFPNLSARVHVRLFDMNASKGGIDKCCQVHVHIPHASTCAVARAVDSDLYRAIQVAFVRLSCNTRSILGRRAVRRAS